MFSTPVWNPGKAVHKEYRLSITLAVVAETYCSKLKIKNHDIKYETSMVELRLFIILYDGERQKNENEARLVTT